MLRVQKVYCCEYDHYINDRGQNCCKVEITSDENIARELDKDYRLASINDVEELLGLGFEPIKVAEVQEGIYGYYEVEFETLLGDIEYFGQYIYLQPNSEQEIKDIANMIRRSMK